MCFTEIWRQLEIGHPLPSVHHAELGMFGRQHRRQWRGLRRAAGGPVLVREVKAELVPVFLDGLQCGDLGIGMTGEAARIKALGVLTGLTMDDLLC